MPVVLPTLISTSKLVDGFNFVSPIRAWLNGMIPGTDILEVRREHWPRPQVYGGPDFAMLGETQDVFGVNMAKVDANKFGDRAQGRNDVFGSMLDQSGKVRLHGCTLRRKLPYLSRVKIDCTISVNLWADAAHPVIVDQYAGFVQLVIREPGQGPVTVAGSRRVVPPLLADTGSAPIHMTGYWEPTVAAKDGETEIWAEYSYDGSEFLVVGGTDYYRLCFTNSTLLVRVWKDYTS